MPVLGDRPGGLVGVLNPYGADAAVRAHDAPFCHSLATPGLISNSYTVVLFVWGTDELEMGLVAKPDGLKEVQVELELLFGLVPIQASYAHL